MKVEQIKISTFTDESGQDTNGRFFVVCTVICLTSASDDLEKELEKIEKSSGKNRKWYKTNDTRRKQYIEGILKAKLLNKISIYYSVYSNKSDYSKLIGSHIAKSIINYVEEKDYKAKVFIDKTNKRNLEQIKNEIKGYRIRYQKVRGISEESSCFIRLADASCGLIRDIDKSGSKVIYKRFMSGIKMV